MYDSVGVNVQRNCVCSLMYFNNGEGEEKSREKGWEFKL